MGPGRVPTRDVAAGVPSSPAIGENCTEPLRVAPRRLKMQEAG